MTDQLGEPTFRNTYIMDHLILQTVTMMKDKGLSIFIPAVQANIPTTMSQISTVLTVIFLSDNTEASFKI